jgi:hypothetical protein
MPAKEESWDLGPAAARGAAPARARAEEKRAGNWEGNLGTRADWERYERGLRRRRWLKFVIPLLLLGPGGYGGYWYWMNEKAAPRTAEVEPNDEPREATLLTPTVALKGHIGRRRSATESDRDFYKLVLGAAAGGKAGAPTPEESRALSVRVTGISNINLKVDILEEAPGPDGRLAATPVVTTDATPRGGDELAVLFPAKRSTYYVLVSEVLKPDEAPTENVSDAYTIFALVEKEPPPPEDPFAKATALKSRDETTLYAGWGFDAAYLRLETEGAKLDVKVSAIAGVKLEVVVYNAKRESLARVTGTEEGAGVNLAVPIAGAGKPFIVVRKVAGESGGSDFTVRADVE